MNTTLWTWNGEWTGIEPAIRDISGKLVKLDLTQWERIVKAVNSYDVMRDALQAVVVCPAFNGQVFEKDKESHRAWTLARHALALSERKP